MLKGILTIYSSETKPEDAYIAVKEHGYWFYIKDSDVTSKATLTLVSTLAAMTGGQPKGPSMTIALPSAK